MSNDPKELPNYPVYNADPTEQEPLNMALPEDGMKVATTAYQIPDDGKTREERMDDAIVAALKRLGGK